ncbi:uncharacterized protein BDR25DRAFT_315495 [Lindgomyces ingoldianus]|uniref:Uncharacterized protein n=1 Tax=Lindgomyces ingoldianus TaxID=673940 RepID=A0ACB6QPU2_9PLEO|nr:uncharacterized protein BDR25DRAFT_315495 [Lindgomyces ingoldianus]KAF2468993.1 hypothetical protein BDR25DRAFT_315495 [Lindgomyces ingoldianus]
MTSQDPQVQKVEALVFLSRGYVNHVLNEGQVMQIALAGICTHAALIGGFKHLATLTPPEIMEAIKWNYIMQCFGILAFIPPKLSDHRVHSKCWDPNVQKNFSIFQGSINVTADVILGLLPSSLIATLNMPSRRRIALCILMGLGLFAAAVGIVKITYLASLTARSDITWDTYDLVVWSGAENFVVLACGSILPMKPLYDRFISDNRLFSWATGKSTTHSYLARAIKDSGDSIPPSVESTGPFVKPSFSDLSATQVSVDLP